MVFDKYRKQYPEKPRPSSTNGEKTTTSSYLSRLAGQVSSDSRSSQPASKIPHKEGLSYGRDAKIWTGSPKPKVEKNVRANIERRLHWVETAFKKPDRQLDDRSKAVSSVRNRINALLTYDLSPKVRSELELIDKELNEII